MRAVLEHQQGRAWVRVSLSLLLASLWLMAAACQSAAPGDRSPPSPDSGPSNCLAEVVPLDVALEPPWSSHWKRLDRTDCRPASWLVRSSETGQSLAQYRSATSGAEAPQRLSVGALSSLSVEEQRLLALVAEFSGLFFQRGTKRVESEELPQAVLATRRGERAGQLDANALLSGLPDACTDGGAACLWLTGEDLYIEGLQYVFGLAHFRRRQGVVSLHRTSRAPPSTSRNSPGKSSRVEPLRRLLKVAVHELGHPFSLQHCVHFRHCLMAGTSSVRENDEGRLSLCPLDHEKLREHLGFDPTQRFLALSSFAAREGLHPEARYWSQMAAQ